MTKNDIQLFLTSLFYEAQDNGEAEKLETMEAELETTKNLKGFVKKHGLKKMLSEFHFDRSK